MDDITVAVQQVFGQASQAALAVIDELIAMSREQAGNDPVALHSHLKESLDTPEFTREYLISTLALVMMAREPSNG